MTVTTEKRTYDGNFTVEQDTGNIIGYGSVFDTRSQDLGGFVEIICKGAFDDVLDNDVRALFNHDPNMVLGRSSSGTLKLSVDDAGLRYEVVPPSTTWANDLVESMKREDINQSSFAFRVKEDDWIYDETEDIVVRYIKKIATLRDVSVVTYPAYTAADSSVRSAQALIEARSADELADNVANQKQYRERFLTTL